MGGVDKTMLISNEINKDIIHTYIIYTLNQTQFSLTLSLVSGRVALPLFRGCCPPFAPILGKKTTSDVFYFLHPCIKHLTVCLIKPS